MSLRTTEYDIGIKQREFKVGPLVVGYLHGTPYGSNGDGERNAHEGSLYFRCGWAGGELGWWKP